MQKYLLFNSIFYMGVVWEPWDLTIVAIVKQFLLIIRPFTFPEFDSFSSSSLLNLGPSQGCRRQLTIARPHHYHYYVATRPNQDMLQNHLVFYIVQQGHTLIYICFILDPICHSWKITTMSLSLASTAD